MSDKRYEANIIRTTAVEPANNLQSTSAPGVWSLDEVMELQKKNKWPTVGNVATDIDDVFSTYLYDGTGSTQTITNGINLSGEGGLVITKRRDSSTGNGPYWNDTERGITSYVRSDSGGGTGAQNTSTGSISSVTSSGYVLGTFNGWNNSSGEYVSWTFRKASKFFDVVTYTGTGNNQNISHNLGSIPGMIITKRTDGTSDWAVYHIGLNGGTNPETKYIRLNLTNIETANSGYWNDTAPTSTQFTVGANGTVNTNGATYIAYLFAHNNNDGGFGPDQDADIIKCGSYTGNGSSTGPTVTLGFEPQWIIVKNTETNGYSWIISDAMRGFNVTDTVNLEADSSDSETTADIGHWAEPTSTGFKLVSNSVSSNANGTNYIYMAIRRGPLAQPTAGTQVFALDTGDGSSDPAFDSGFPVDFAFYKDKNSVNNWIVGSRLQQKKYMSFDNTTTETTLNNMMFDYQDHWYSGTRNSYQVSWMWKRAPGYFDVVAYPASSISTLINHNLGVPVEMAWIKSRTSTQAWNVLFYDQLLEGSFGSTGALTTLNSFYTSTATTFKSPVHAVNQDYIAYLFATVAGVSKVGSYTADGNAQNIDCGFSSGAKFVLIKRSDNSGNWFILDTERGIVAGNDPLLELNSSNAQDSGYDNMDPYNAGFTITAYGGTSPYLNISGATYIFYAIA